MLLAAPTEAKAGTSFAVALAVRGTTARLRVVASSPAGMTAVLAGRSGHRDDHVGRLRIDDVPVHIAVAPDGSLIVAEAQGAVVSRIAPNGRVTTIGR